MLCPRPSKQIVGALVAGALCFSSTTAAAATLPASSISPWVALSSLSTPASAAAVCTAGAAAVTAAQAPSAGCVLPVVDQPVPPPPVATPAAVPVAEHHGIGTLPILLGLAAIAGVVAWLLLHDDDDHDNGNEPISPA